MSAYLLSYKIEKFQALNSHSTTFELEIEKVSFFGLIRRKVRSKYKVPNHHSIKNYTDTWDTLIKEKQKLQ